MKREPLQIWKTKKTWELLKDTYRIHVHMHQKAALKPAGNTSLRQLYRSINYSHKWGQKMPNASLKSIVSTSVKNNSSIFINLLEKKILMI